MENEITKIKIDGATVEAAIIPNASNYAADKDGNIYSLKKRRKLTPCSAGWSGYKQVKIVMDDGRSVCKTVHRLVYTAWHGEVPKGLEIHHVDEEKSNNSLANLQAISHKANCRHSAAKTGESIRLAKRGIKRGLRPTAYDNAKTHMPESTKTKIKARIAEYREE